MNVDRIKCEIRPLEEIVHMEIGWYWRVVSVDRNRGLVEFCLAKKAYTNPNWLDRLMGKKSEAVVFLADGEH